MFLLLSDSYFWFNTQNARLFIIINPIKIKMGLSILVRSLYLYFASKF